MSTSCRHVTKTSAHAGRVQNAKHRTSSGVACLLGSGLSDGEWVTLGAHETGDLAILVAVLRDRQPSLHMSCSAGLQLAWHPRLSEADVQGPGLSYGEWVTLGAREGSPCNRGGFPVLLPAPGFTSMSVRDCD